MHFYARLHPLQRVMPVFAVMAAFSAHSQHAMLYAVLKPIPLLLLLACVWQLSDRRRYPHATWLLLAGLALSLQGDIWLLRTEGFLPGLASFWLAHACYIGLFRRDRPWQGHVWAIATLGSGLAAGTAYFYLWNNGLPPSMRLPVLAYVTVIGLMSAYALARAGTLRTPAAWSVAAGAVSFLVSDTFLAINKFVHPVPAAQLWILGTYYLAQWLIVYGMLPTLRSTPRHAP